MKKNVFKTLIALSVAAVLLVAFSLSTLATETVKVTYKYGDYIHNEYVDVGEEFIPFAPTDGDSDDVFYGWVDNRGNLFPKDSSASVDKDTTLYIVSGSEVSTAEELLSAIEQGDTYIKLNKNIRIDTQLHLNSGVFVIDTNNYTLTINTDGDAIYGSDTGIVFTGSGAVKHTFDGANPNFILNSFISLSPTTSFNTLFVNVCKDVTVSTNVGLVGITTDISKKSGVFNASVYGTLICDRFMRTNGISNASFDIYESASVTTGCEYFFEDISSTTAKRLVNLTIHGGTHTFNKLSGYASNYEKYQAAILGGIYTTDITGCFPAGNYSFILDYKTNTYSFGGCTHSGPAVSGMPSSCTEPATITYKCEYCNKEYSKTFADGIGHSMVTSVEKELVATEEETSAGIYKHYCQKCDEVTTYETFYPRPTEVYVTVIVLDQKGSEKKLRIPSRELYTFDAKNTTQANSFSTEYIQYNYNITQENIISVEVPLGTTDIHGTFTHDSGVGLFCENPHLWEVVLPESLVNVQKYAFHNMPKLKSIKGIEYITGTIGERAFSQEHTNTFIDQMTVNARVISGFAFHNIRMNSLTFGASVTSIGGAAFYLDSDADPVKEVIVEGYQPVTNDPITVSTVFSNYVRKSYSSSNQQFGSRKIVYGDHQCDITVFPAECLKDGYSLYECKFCGYEKTDNFTPRLYHNFENVHILPTCLTQGYTVDKCLNCAAELEGTKVVSEKRDPNAHDYTYSTTYVYITEDGDVIKTGSICEDPHCIVGKCKCGALDYSTVSASTVIKALGPHKYDIENMEVIKKPTCVTGLALVPCTVCQNKYESDLPATDVHNGPETIVQAPTCTTEGEKIFTCKLCNYVFERKTIKPLGKDTDIDSAHTWSGAIQVKDPTQTEVGLNMFTCEKCGAEKSEAIPRLPLEKKLSGGIIALIVIGGVLVVGGTVITLYFTLFKKKRASDSYKYKFNTLGK